jgi:hypothetical protein
MGWGKFAGAGLSVWGVYSVWRRHAQGVSKYLVGE